MTDQRIAADLYLDVSERLLRLRLEREVSMDEEGEWASVLDAFWGDLDEEGRKMVEISLRLPARRALIDAGVAKQKEYEKVE